MSHKITVESGTSVRLPTAGKYCDRDIVVTATGGAEDLDDVLTEQEALITELQDTLRGKAAGGAANPVIEPLEITENGAYTAPDGVDGYSPVTVNVPTGGGSEVARSIVDKTITEYRDSEVMLIGEYAFFRTNTLTTVDCPNANNIGSYSFSLCEALVTVNIPKLRGSGTGSFSTCGSLEAVNFPDLQEGANQMFYNCKKLTSVNLPSINTVSSEMFSGCNALRIIRLQEVTSVSTKAFNSCISLTTVDLPKGTKINTYAFNYCYKLTALILRSATVYSLSNTNAFTKCYHILGTVNLTYNPEGLKDGYIYVPSALVDSYKSATNWSNYASQFRAIEDYPEICGEVTA